MPLWNLSLGRSSFLKRSKFSSVKPSPLSETVILSVSGLSNACTSISMLTSVAPASRALATASKYTNVNDGLGKNSLIAPDVSMSIVCLSKAHGLSTQGIQKPCVGFDTMGSPAHHHSTTNRSLLASLPLHRSVIN